MVDYTLWLDDFLDIAEKYISEEQRVLLHTLNVVSRDINYMLGFVKYSYSKNKTYAQAYDDIKAEVVDADDPNDTGGILMVIADATMKDNDKKTHRTHISMQRYLSQLMIEKIKAEPKKYRSYFRYARYLLKMEKVKNMHKWASSKFMFG